MLECIAKGFQVSSTTHGNNSIGFVPEIRLPEELFADTLHTLPSRDGQRQFLSCQLTWIGLMLGELRAINGHDLPLH